MNVTWMCIVPLIPYYLLVAGGQGGPLLCCLVQISKRKEKRVCCLCYLRNIQVEEVNWLVIL